MLTLAKAFSGLGGFVILIIGVMMLCVTIWAFVNASLAFNQYTFLGILLAADLVIIFAAVLGILGIKKQNGVMICVFQIFVMLFFFVFLGMGIGSITLPKTVFSGNCTDSDFSLIEIARESYTVSTTNFCVTCGCGLTDEAINNGNWSVLEQASLRAANRTVGGPINYQNCPSSKQFN